MCEVEHAAGVNFGEKPRYHGRVAVCFCSTQKLGCSIGYQFFNHRLAFFGGGASISRCSYENQNRNDHNNNDNHHHSSNNNNNNNNNNHNVFLAANFPLQGKE